MNSKIRSKLNFFVVGLLQITGSKAPSLRRLAQWLLENPSYDVDPKWAELVKERGNLPHELLKRLPGGGGSSGGDRKAKGPGRPALLNSPPETPTSSASGQGFPLTSSSLLFDPKNPLFDPKSPLFDPKTNPFLDPKNSSLFDSKNPLLDPKNLSLLDPKNNPLFDPKNSALFDPKTNPFFDPKNNPFLDPKNNSLFDPKNNPLFDPKNPLFDPKNNPLFDPKNSSLFDPKMFLPFGGLPNMGALGAMNPLGNPMNLFANLASLGLPSLAGLDGSGSGMTSDQAASPGGSGSKAKPRKGQEERHGSSGKTTPVSAASQLPYFFPNPSMLYSPLSLSGLNPFSLPPSALSSAYDSLAQQCNLLNGGAGSSRSTGRGSGGGGNSSSSSKLPMGTSSPRHRGNSSTSSSPRDTAASSLQHLLLPHDTQLLESLSRKPKADSSARAADAKQRKPEHKDLLSTQSLLMSSLSEMDDRMLRRFRDGDMKEALEALSRTSAEFLAKSIGDTKPPSLGADVAHMNMSDLLSRTIDDNRPKEVAMKEALALSGTSMTEVTKQNEMMNKAVDSATPPQPQPPPPPPSKSADPPVKRKRDPEPPAPAPAVAAAAAAVAAPADVDVEDLLTSTTVTKSEPDQQPPQTECEAPSETETASEPEKQRAAAKRTRGGKKSRSKSDPDEVPAVERKNLRSSAGRAARAAAERAAREASREDDFAAEPDSHDES